MLGQSFSSSIFDACTEKPIPKNPYISCIKIAGVHILPPLITPEKRREIEKYRQQAIEVERRIKTRTEQKKLTLTLNKTLENSLAFDSLTLEDACDEKKPEQNLVPLTTKTSQLSSNIFDVTEYSDNGIILFNDSDNCEDHSNALPQPRLVRSNSYTLDAPSPILMEHFKKHMREPDSSTSCVAKKNLFSIDDIIKDLASVHFGNLKPSTDSGPNYTTQFVQCANKTFNAAECSTSEPDSSSVLLIDFESDTGENLTFCCDDSLSKASIFDSDACCSPNLMDQNKGNCSRALFLDSPKALRKLKEDWAATVLTAAVKGYLVRRLKRTERVTSLIQTIRDTLLCAMSLHTEKNDAIQPPDVELHRRLIQQISAACYEFHDIFLNTTIKERLEIIAADRQKLKEKLKRPNSAIKSDSESSRKSSIRSKQKKTLVSSLVA